MRTAQVGLLAGALLLQAGQSSSAEVLLYEFRGQIGTVSSATTSVTPSIYIGSPFSVIFQIDTSTLLDRDGPSSLGGNFWAISDANYVSVKLGGLRFVSSPANTHRATVQTHVSQEVKFIGFRFDSPQFTDTGSGTTVHVLLRDELFAREVPTSLPELSLMQSANWGMTMFNGPDGFTVSGVLDSSSVTIVPEPSSILIAFGALVFVMRDGRRSKFIKSNFA